mgnify:FL=1
MRSSQRDCVLPYIASNNGTVTLKDVLLTDAAYDLNGGDPVRKSGRAQVDLGEGYYRILVRIIDQRLERNGMHMNATPGMTATVEIKTGQKTVLVYLLRQLQWVRQAFVLHLAGLTRSTGPDIELGLYLLVGRRIATASRTLQPTSILDLNFSAKQLHAFQMPQVQRDRLSLVTQ